LRPGQGISILQHGKLRGSCRPRAEPDLFDLGNEPPLSVDGRNAALIDRRRISIRWYAGTILTGLSGAALMCGAVYAALDGETHFAAMPERLEALRSAGNSEKAATIRKTDRLQAQSESFGARQVMRVSTTTRVGEREVVRMRPVVKVAANLTLTTSELSANIPKFNPARLLASTSANGVPTPEEALPVDDAEISFVMRDLGPLLGRVKIASALPADDVIARVREAADWSLGSQQTALASAAGNGSRLAYAAEGNPDPYLGFETRVVPENITLLPKTAGQITGGNSWNERLVVAKKNEGISQILRELGATPEEAKAVANALGPRGRDGALKEGQKLKILLSAMGPAQRLQPIRVVVMGDSAPEAVVALSDTGRYVSVDVQHADTPQQVAEAEEDDEDSGAVRLYQSVYETALRQQVPRAIIDEIIRIYSYDVDFQRKVQAGDSFELLYPGDEENTGEKADVFYAALTIAGETKRYYRYHTQDDSIVDYYDETGKSAKKFLVRKPVDSGLMRSGYGWRRHPILGYSKMHTGVDWSAPRGTAIYASGNGTIDRVGWEGGYGKYVRIKHAYGYETAYGHMSAFARNVAPGVKVRQGQVIGYVGSTGLSTGSHLHYEILVNGRFVDPARIKLPRGRSLEGALLASFEQERDRLDAMMNRTADRVADGTPAVSGKTRRR
jgi:murein DD-endopeptidase MepM/ murein hydrolase activator NlpD